MKLQDICVERFKILQRELSVIRAAMSHSQSKGYSLEKAVSNFISMMLPNNLEMASGFVVDSTGKISKQMDIIIYDKLRSAPFFYSNGIIVMPVEFVYCVIEVKTQLNPSMLAEIQASADSIKCLSKRCLYHSSIIEFDYSYHGKVYNKENGMLPPCIYIVFALESSSPGALKDKLNELDLNRDIDKRIDFIFTPTGCITNATNMGSDLLPSLGIPEKGKPPTIRAVHPDSGDIDKQLELLPLWFYGVFSKYIYQFKLGSYDFNFIEYYNAWSKEM